MSIKNFFKGVYGITKSVLGIGIAPVVVQQKRSVLCFNCENRVMGKFSKKAECSVCGCILEHKIRINKEKCPLEFPKW